MRVTGTIRPRRAASRDFVWTPSWSHVQVPCAALLWMLQQLQLSAIENMYFVVCNAAGSGPRGQGEFLVPKLHALLRCRGIMACQGGALQCPRGCICMRNRLGTPSTLVCAATAEYRMTCSRDCQASYVCTAGRAVCLLRAVGGCSISFKVGTYSSDVYSISAAG